MNLNIIRKKDDVFSIRLPGSDLVFTRYLYIKDEVRLALLVSLLNKSEDAIFWAYELYYSGFKFELFELLWKIYYDFFATLNSSFEALLSKKQNELFNQQDVQDTRIIGSIIQTLLFRPFNTDIFILRNICENFEIDVSYYTNKKTIVNKEEVTNQFEQWISRRDYRSISQWILNENNIISSEEIYIVCLKYFEKIGMKLPINKLTKEFITITKESNPINTNIILLSKIICLFSKKDQLKSGKSVYINVEPEDIIPYETVEVNDYIKHYHILEKACMCGIDEWKFLSLFKLKRKKYNIEKKYYYNWLYHASFSPIWSNRIRDHQGYPDYNKQMIVFKENKIDSFYNLFGYEPDEQKKGIQEKSIIKISKKNSWHTFIQQFKKNGLVEIYEEELDEFDHDGLIY